MSTPIILLDGPFAGEVRLHDGSRNYYAAMHPPPLDHRFYGSPSDPSRQPVRVHVAQYRRSRTIRRDGVPAYYLNGFSWAPA
jgi:hypothetical protein